MQQDDHVRVLFLGTGVAQVAGQRALVGAVLRTPVQLGQHDHRDGELARYELSSRDSSRRPGWGLHAGPGFHQAEVVHN